MNPFDLDAGDALLGHRRRDSAARHAFAEFYALVAAAERIEDVRPSDLLRIGRRHGVDLAEHFAEARRTLYERYAEALLGEAPPVSADVLPEDARHRLDGFAAALHLPAEAMHEAHGRVFGRVALRAIADLRLSPVEAARLYRLKRALGLDIGVARLAYEVLAREQLVLRLARHLADGRLSTSAARDMEAAQAALGVALPAELEATATCAGGDRPLPRGSADGIHLRSSETLYAIVLGRWHAALEGKLARALPPGSRPLLRENRTSRLAFPDAARGTPVRTGYVLVTDERLLLVPIERSRRTYPLASLREALAFSGGVLLRFRGPRAVFADLDPVDTDQVMGALRTVSALKGYPVVLSAPD